jgi:hypothetical protein
LLGLTLSISMCLVDSWLCCHHGVTWESRIEAFDYCKIVILTDKVMGYSCAPFVSLSMYCGWMTWLCMASGVLMHMYMIFLCG